MIYRKSFSFILGFFVMLGVFGWTACNKLDEVNDATFENSDAEFAIPLFKSTVSFQDIIDNFDENTFVTIEPDGLIRLNYKGDVLRVGSDDLFSNFPIIPFPILDTNYVVPADIPGSIDIDFMDIKKGGALFRFQNRHDRAFTVDVEVEEFQKDGESLHLTFDIAASNGSPVEANIPLNLAGWRWDAVDDKFTIVYTALDENGVRDTLDNASITLIGLEYSYAEGYLGNDLYLIGRDTIDIDFFDNWTRGDIYFEDPRIFLTAFNSFGFPMDGQFENIFVQTVDGELIPLESEFITEGVFLDYPKLDEVGTTKATYFSFNKDNSNIREVLGAGPTAIDYRLDGEPNPAMDESIRGFMLDSSELRVQMEVELPIYGSASGFVVRDTFDVDFGAYDQVEQAEFKLITENNMPLSADVQLYFLDEAGGVVDSLLNLEERVLVAAPVDNAGNVEAVTNNTQFIPISAERLDNILAAQKIILKTAFSTTNDGSVSVRVLADQHVNVRMGVKFGM